MELSQFVQNTIQQIIEGVSKSQEFAKDNGATINPSGLRFKRDGQLNYHETPMQQDIVFDVGLTSTSVDGSTEGIGVFLGGISLGKKNEAGLESTAITKIKFTVPIILPSGGKYEETT